jgi:uncharacterized protein (DUF924 family)
MGLPLCEPRSCTAPAGAGRREGGACGTLRPVPETSSTSAEAVPAAARAVLDFWFGAPGSAWRGERRAEWWTKNPAFDAQIRARFSSWIERALAGQLRSWAQTPEGALAQIVLLDQFTRNAWRDTPRAYAGDARALDAARAMLHTGQDLLLPPEQRAFVYMPLEHAESLEAQDEGVRRFEQLVRESPVHADQLDYAQRHRHVVARFGRFPHRNRILARASTPEEEAFLLEPGSSF